MTRKIILVGQAPGSRKGEPLDGASGRRLSALAGMDHAKFLDRFERIALLPEWSKNASQDRAKQLLGEARDRADHLREKWRGRKVVLIDRAVAAAFRLVPDDYTWFKPIEIPPGIEVAVMPHPSGISMWWNDPANVEAARAFMQRLNVGLFTLKRAVEKNHPSGRPEMFDPAQIAAALVAAGGLLGPAAKVLAEETGASVPRQTVKNYCERYPELMEIRERCREDLGDEAEQNIANAVRDGDAELSLKLLRCEMFAGRGYGSVISARVDGRIQHDHRHAHAHVHATLDQMRGKITDQEVDVLEGIYERLMLAPAEIPDKGSEG